MGVIHLEWIGKSGPIFTCRSGCGGGSIASMNEELTLWKGSPSQWLNIGAFGLAIGASVGIIAGGLFFPPAFVALVLPLGFAVWKYLLVRTQVFELTSERLRVTSGVINQQVDEIELYRVKDSLMIRVWWMRLTGLASIELETSDRSIPKLSIPAIPNGQEVREILRKQVEMIRDRKRVRELDFEGMAANGEGESDPMA